MKRLLPLLAALALPTAVEANWFGKYNSRAEAWEACNKWQYGKKIYYSDFELPIKKYSKLLRESEKANDYASRKTAKNDLLLVKEMSARSCSEEKETMQILGYGYNGLKDDYIYYTNTDFWWEKRSKIQKYFKY